MQPDALFSIANKIVLLGWLALAFAPWRSGLPRLVVLTVALGMSLLYAGLLGAFWAQGGGDFTSLEGVSTLFAHPGKLLAGWVHYLAFDLLVGLWEREQAHRLGISRWMLLPCLLLTFLFGPIGWLAFLALRQYRMSISHVAAGEPA